MKLKSLLWLLLCCPLSLFATTNHYFFINNSQQTVYARFNQSGELKTVKPWQKLPLLTDQIDAATYTLSIYHQPLASTATPIVLSLATKKCQKDGAALTVENKQSLKTVYLYPSDQYLPPLLKRNVKLVWLISSADFSWQGHAYKMYVGDLVTNHLTSPMREIDITLSQAIPHFKRNDVDNHQLDVLTYNVQLWDDFSTLSGMRANQATRRATLIPQKIGQYDVVIAEELMSTDGLQGRRKLFAQQMSKLGYSYQYGPILNTLGMSGGVMIFSHWPLSHQAQYRFPAKDTAGIDSLSAKGVLYAQVNKNGQIYHVFASHTQADEEKDGPVKDRLARERQFYAMHNFIDQQQIPATQPVIIAGDLNVDYQKCKQHFDCGEYTLTIQQLTDKKQAWKNIATLPYGSDPSINLMNTDDAAGMYDYILMLSNPSHPAPAFNKQSRIRVIRAPEAAQLYAGGSAANPDKTPFGQCDLSDHFALEAEFHLTAKR